MSISSPAIVAIAAVARNGVIGAGADIPWRIPEDWHRFKRLTTGQTLIMGRKTYDSIGRPLPGRRTVVITRDPEWSREGVEVGPDLRSALALATSHCSQTIFVAGGGEIYREAWALLTGLEITEVDAIPNGDVTFPPISAAEWVETARDQRRGFAFVTYGRREENSA